jgi:hypothetical protein
MSRAYWTARRLGELDAQLSERDRAVLDRVAELRFVSGAQLIRLHFAGTSERTARQALLRLVRLEVLERLPRAIGGMRAGSGAFVYRLGPAGQRLVGETWRPHVPGTLFVAHSLRVAELHTLLAEADRAGQVELLQASAEPACWRRYPSGRLKPDSYVRLGAGEYEDSYFVEIDMGTEGSRALLTKLRQYAEYQRNGIEQAEHGVFPKVLWTTLNETRADVIRGCVERLPSEARELFVAVPFADAPDFLAPDRAGHGSRRPAQ